MSLSFILYILISYLVIVGIISFIIVPVDKHKAQADKWRVKESTLFLLSAIGGAVPMYISMQLFRHKTKHKSFMIGIPLIFLCHLIIAGAAYWFLFVK